MYVAVTLAVFFSDPFSVELTELEINGDTYPMWLIGICTIILMIIAFLLMATYRVWERKKRRLVDKVFYYFMCFKFDKYWIFLSISAVIVWIAGIIGWATTGSYDFLIISLFMPFIWACFLTAYANWASNDYEMLLNIKEHNIKLTKIKE